MSTREQYFAEASQYIRWDPSDDQEDYKIELNESKFRHVVKRFIKEHHKEFEQQIVDVTGDTLYKSLEFDKMPGINQLFLVHGDVSIEDFTQLYRDGLTDRGKYKFLVKSPEEFVEKAEQMFRDLFERGATYVSASSKDTPETVTLKPLVGAKALVVDELLKEGGNSSFNEIVDSFDRLASTAADADKKISAEVALREKTEAELAEVKEAMSALKVKALVAPTTVAELPGDGELPTGKLVMRKASEIFDSNLLQTDFEIPTWQWEYTNPHVPAVDEHYIFRQKELSRVLLAIVTNRRLYLHGHTGTGKTTLIEQVAARIGYMTNRINFDSEITRGDLIGRDTLVHEDGKQVSKFVDGILPRMMSGPFIGIFDEVDFSRPDVSYVLQAPLEGSPLRITEDGDRIVYPHPRFRLFATGNTVGQGDEHGMYAGARVQSLAFMNRFNLFCHVDYLEEKQREDLVKRQYPELSSDLRGQLMAYVTEHMKAFENQDIILPISPRGYLGVALSTVLTGDLRGALEAAFVDGASEENRSVLLGIIDRVVK
jgi:cobaltochelatase CobS